MYNIKTLNSISPVYADVLDLEKYAVNADIENPDAIIVRSADMHAYEPAENMLCVARAGAGYNNIPVDEYAEKGIVAFNTPGANANAVKELAITGLLLASRKIVSGIEWCDTIKDQGDQVGKLVEKGKSKFVGPELAGKTLGVIGLGAIGRLVANTCLGLDMRVMGNDPYISVDNAWQLARDVVHSTDMDKMLGECDYVSIHVPLTDNTKNMFNADTIAKMKDGAVLMNFSRGGLVDNAAVIEAVTSGKLRAYVTDFPAAELIGVEGIICIPHLGASTPESEDNCVRMASRQISAYLENGSIINSVNYPNCELGPVIKPRICVLHQNIPNVIQAVLKTVTESGENINIDNMVNKSRGKYACTVLDMDHTPSEALVAKIAELDTAYRVRLLMP
ncbi:MAG: 3-phosphoglycerate dehydrogenase [Clostridia bacterium]|nr:3-phosphoglycerate dehydrogenase [Clostridia bacterium]